MLPAEWRTGSKVEAHRFSCSMVMWHLPRPGIERVLPHWQVNYYPLHHPRSPKRSNSQVAHMCVCAKLLQSCLTLCNPMDCNPPGFSVHGDSPGKNTGVGCHALLQGNFPTQESNPGLLHCRQILYYLSYQGSL